MIAPLSILIYGRDPSLVETRAWVLEREGYGICRALVLGEVKRMVQTQPIALLMLCHSLSVEACDEALAAVRATCPEMKTLLVTANTVVAPSAQGTMSVSAFDGPRAMIQAVSKALGTEVNGTDKA